MKKIIVILVLTLVFSQKTQSQQSQPLVTELGSALVSDLFTSKKKQKKLERENFVIDSTNNAIETSKKREIFVRDSITENRLIEEKKKSQLEYISWLYSCNKCKFKQYKLNPKSSIAIIKIISEKDGSFGVERRQDEKYNYIDSDEKYKSNIEEAKLRTLSVEIYADTTATNKIGVINLAELPLDEVFVEVAYKRIENENITIYPNTYSVNENHLVMLKSVKTNKAYVIRNYAYNFYDEVSKSGLFKNYTDPQVLTQEKLALNNYRLKLNNAMSTVAKLEAILSKHIYQRVNANGVVIEEGYKVDKFTTAEKVTYKQLIQKLKTQRDDINIELDKKVGYKSLRNDLIDTPDINKQMEIEHAYLDYMYNVK